MKLRMKDCYIACQRNWLPFTHHLTNAQSRIQVILPRTPKEDDGRCSMLNRSSPRSMQVATRDKAQLASRYPLRGRRPAWRKNSAIGSIECIWRLYAFLHICGPLSSRGRLEIRIRNGAWQRLHRNRELESNGCGARLSCTVDKHGCGKCQMTGIPWADLIMYLFFSEGIC